MKINSNKFKTLFLFRLKKRTGERITQQTLGGLEQ